MNSDTPNENLVNKHGIESESEIPLTSLERLRLFEDIVNNGPYVTFIWRVTDGKPLEFVSDNIQQFGYTREDFMSGRVKFLDIVHPDDSQRVVSEMSEDTHGMHMEHELEYRIFTKSGELRWVGVRAWIRRDLAEGITYYQNVLFDSTERKSAEEELERNIAERTSLCDFTNSQLIAEIAERRQAEESLKESEEQLRTLINAMPDIVCFKDGEGRWLEANEFDLQLFELTGVDYRGKTDCDLAPYSEYYREAFMACGETDENAWRAGHMVRADEIIPVPNGPSRVFDIFKVPTFYPDGRRKGLVVIGRDITQRVAAEDALKASERRLADIINFLPDATIAIDRKGIIIAWNRATELLTGFKAEDMIGKGNYEYSIPFYGDRRPMLIDMVLMREMANKMYSTLKVEGDTLTVEAYLPTMSSEGTYIWGKATPLYDAYGKVAGAIETIRDITDRVKATEAARAVEDHKREFYRRTILAATEGKLVITDAKQIERIAGPALKSWEILNGRDLSNIRNDAGKIAIEAGMDESRLYDFVLCIGESTTNAYKHANGGRASIHRLANSILFVVSDSGLGIDAVTLPEVALVKGYSTAGTLGMGYKAIISIADKVYLATASTGTTVAIEMNFHPATPAPLTLSIPDTWK